MIYVDSLTPCEKNKKWKWNESCHLFTDDDDIGNLHLFAKSIGLKRQWFQDHKIMPHYDLTKNMRIKAVRRGAVEASPAKMLAVLNLWRKRRGILTLA